eukprot:5337213-Pyramimonas_sp.AAC.1
MSSTEAFFGTRLVRLLFVVAASASQRKETIPGIFSRRTNQTQEARVQYSTVQYSTVQCSKSSYW